MTLHLVNDVERELATKAADLTTPSDRECVLCFVDRMLDDFGCDCTLRWAKHWRDLCAPSATALERRFGSVGGHCDCEIFLNGYDPTWPGAEDEEQPSPRPACRRVSRRGSTRPCGLWRRRTRGSWYG
jgi:hypothetical protein